MRSTIGQRFFVEVIRLREKKFCSKSAQESSGYSISIIFEPPCTRDRTRLCVFRMQVYIRVGGLPISPVCSWSKAESRFCSPCHSVSTLVKGLLGESNTLPPSSTDSTLSLSLLYIRKKETVGSVL